MTSDQLLDIVADYRIDDDATGRDVFDETRALVTLRNLIDHQLSTHTAALERLGVAKRAGGRTKGLLIEMGLAPTVAARLVRIAGDLTQLTRTTAQAGDGHLSGEHVDAVVRGIRHVEKRAPDGLTDEQRRTVETDLLAQASSGATPAEIADRARAVGNSHAADSGDGVAAADDRTINTLDCAQTDDGRLRITADMDIVTGEKFTALIEAWSLKRPEPDGSPDTRSAGRRRADALDRMIDSAHAHARIDGTSNRDNDSPSGTRESATTPRSLVSVTIPADEPDLSRLQWLGSMSERTLRLVSCDASVTPVVIDGQHVPLDMGRERRLFPPALRRAIEIRDGGTCVKCGGPCGHAHVHHMVHWADGGTTCLDNGCLLCPSCHADVHNLGWDIVLGADRHPWLIPPVSADPRRQPRPAYNRRTLTIDGTTAAA